MPMGPYQMADLAGIDIGWHREPNRIENIRDKPCAMERWGQKKGAGFYDYDVTRRPPPPPVVAEVIEEFRKKAGIVKPEITDQANMERTTYTLDNEAPKLLEKDIAKATTRLNVGRAQGLGWHI